MWDWLSELHEIRQRGEPAAVVTVTACSGSTPRGPGTKMIVKAEGQLLGTIGGGRLEELVTRDALACMARGEPGGFSYPLGASAAQCCGGVVEVFIEVLGVGPRLYVFGAGHVGQALCRVLDGTAFSIDLIDDRDEWIHAPGIPTSVRRHAGEWDAFVASARWEPRDTYAVVMTYRHDLDQEIVHDLLRRPLRWIGLIGSRTKWEKFRRRLTDRGVSAEDLARVRCPVGIPLGGKAPAEVAISIAAEVLREHHQPEAR